MPDRKIWVSIVDDNVVARKTTGKLLSKKGFEIIFAEDGEKAMKIIEFCTPDCILLDLVMPKVHGHAFLLWLRKKNQTLPVIILSAIEEQPDLVSTLEKLGIEGWISKPCNPQEATRMIMKAIEPDKDTTNADLETTTPDDGQL